MDGIIIDKTLPCSEFMSEMLEGNVGKLERSVGVDPVVIYLGWLWSVKNKIQVVHKQTVSKNVFNRKCRLW